MVEGMSDNRPNISVIIPVYNNEMYICRCLDSVLMQTYTNYEIIIIDDGSTDGSGAICDQYQKNHKNIHVIHQRNMGLASSRKTGIENANGKYVTFIDSDDYVSRELLEYLYNYIEDYDIITCAHTVISASKERAKIPFKEEYRDIQNTEQMIRMFFEEKYIEASAWGKLVKRDLYFQIDMCEGAVPGEEICTSLQLLRLANGIRILSKPLYFYWQNLQGISHSGYTDRHRKGLENYIKICDLLIQDYPQYEKMIGTYFCKYEMSIMTAMVRNNRYEKEVILMLQEQLKKYFWKLLCNNNTALYYKISATMIIIDYRSFSFIFGRIRKIFSR